MEAAGPERARAVGPRSRHDPRARRSRPLAASWSSLEPAGSGVRNATGRPRSAISIGSRDSSTSLKWRLAFWRSSRIPIERGMCYLSHMRIGAVDLGTNSTRLLVADVDRVGGVTEVVRRLAITRLGEGVDMHHELLPAAMSRVHAVLDGYAAEAAALGSERVLAVATSAVRDAANGSAFLADLGRRYGWETRLLDGEQEAETTFSGVTSDRSLETDTLMVDIGGGSTELLVGGPAGVSFATSLQLGCVRVTERYLATDPPTARELDAAAAHARSLLPPLSVATAIGVAGTITTLAAIDLGLEEYDPVRIHGHPISAHAVDDAIRSLSGMPLAARERVKGLEPARAPVIVGGLIVLREILDRYDLDVIEASERDILHGTAIAAADLDLKPPV